MGAYKMRKKLLAGIVILSLIASLMACGRSEAQQVDTTADTPVVEEEKAEPEPKAEPVVEEKEPEEIEEKAEEVEEEQADYAYASLYLKEINQLYNGIEMPDRFSLINIDGDNIPELLALSETDSFLYTVYNNQVSLLISGLYIGMYRCHLEYSEGNNLIYSGGGDVSFSEGFDKISQGKAVRLLSLEWDEKYDPEIGESVAYCMVNNEEVSEKEYYNNIRTYMEANSPFISAGQDGLHTYEISYNNDGLDEWDEIGDVKPYMTHEEITTELTNLIKEANAEKYKDAEPWKLVYSNLLHDILCEVTILSDGCHSEAPYYNGNVVFTLLDITKDDIPELLASRKWDDSEWSAPDWNVFKYDGKDGYKYIERMAFYDGESGKFYSDEGWDDDREYYTWMVKNEEIVRDTGIMIEGYYEEDGYTSRYMWIRYYKENNNDSDFRLEEIKEATSDDWDAFEAGYKAGVEKYGIKDYYELTPKNIDIALGVSSGIPEKNEEMANNDDNSDSTLYSVEVTAPDGYVNLRNGAGTDNAIITSISNGETLLVYEEANSGKWLKVEYQGNEGWVAASQVTKK